jgi:DNA polymerase III epsilon subunit-like protein
MGLAAPIVECYISVDIEAAGPNPADCSLLAIGACLVQDPTRSFYVELQPTHTRFDLSASAVHGLSLERLQREGLAPEAAMQQFADWIDQAGGSARPVFVGFNAPFDWMFVADYFHHYLGRNPFGHSALDIKSFYMGAALVPFARTSLADLTARFPELHGLSHNARQDAIDQAAVFRRVLEWRGMSLEGMAT